MKRVFTLLLALVMCLSLLPGITVSADADYSGTYYIATKRDEGNYFYMTNDLGTASTKRYQAVDSGLTTLPESITSAEAEAAKTFTLTRNADGSYYVQDSAGKYLDHSSSNSGILATDVANALKITIAADAATGTVQFNTTSDKARILALNSNADYNYFAWYGSGQSNKLVLIPVETEDGGDSNVCEHTNTTSTTVDASCTEPGSITVTCKDCQETVSTETIAPLGHSLVEGTCSVCGLTPLNISGTYYIATIREDGNYFYMTNNLGTASTKRYTAVDSGLTVLPEAISTAVADPTMTFTLTMDNYGTYYISDSEGKYLGYTSGNSGTLVELEKAQKLELTMAEDGTVEISLVSDSTKKLSLNTQNSYFAWYAGTQIQNLSLIPVVEGACSHATTELQNAVAATCTADGYTGDQVCTECGEIAASGSVIKSQGHQYEGTVTAPSAGVVGFTTYICSVCGDTYTEELALYTVSFAVPNGAEAIENAHYTYEAVVLPEVPAMEGYQALGWAVESIAVTDTAPEYMVPGTAYQPTKDTVLFPVYTYEDAALDVISWVKTDFASITSADEVIITMDASGTVYALPNAKASSTGPAAVIVTVEGDQLMVDDASAYAWTISAVDGGYTISANGLYLSSTNNNNGIRVNTTKGVWTLDGNYLKTSANGTARWLGIYLPNPDWRAYTNTTNNTKNQVVGFYKKTATAAGGQSVLYTSLDAIIPVNVAQITAFDGVHKYISLENAVLACEDGDYVKLLQDIENDVTIGKTVYIDLAGNSIGGYVTIAEGVTLYGMDTKTNGYSDKNYGTMNISEESAGILAETVRSVSDSGNVYRYLTVEEDGAYSFHRYYVGVTKLSLRTTEKGFGYKVRFAGSEKVQSQLEGFGIRLWLEGSDKVVTKTISMENFDSNKEFSLVLRDFDIENYGDINVNVEGFLTLAEGDELKSSSVSYSMKTMLGMVASNLANFTAGQIQGIQQMLSDAEKTVVSQWGYDAILNWVAPEN